MFLKRVLSACMALVIIISQAVTVLATGAPEVSAQSAILIEADTGRVLYDKNAQHQMSMASTTKIMTALLALESGDLDTYFTVDPTAIKVEGSSMGLQEGDQVTMRTLAYGMLLLSGNDAANSAAVKVAGSAPDFANLMNERAQKIGMTNSHFVTPSGLDDGQHYSTAEDMAKLARTALQNDQFLEICSKYQTQVQYGNPPYNRWMTNHNRLLKEYEGTIGVKTGFTKKSGRCLVSAAERNGVRLIVVTLNAPNDWSDHKSLFDYGFSNAHPVQLDSDFSHWSLTVVGGTNETIGVVPLNQPAASILQEDLTKVQMKIRAHPFYYAPVRMGDVVGEAEYWLDGQCIESVTLLANGSSDQYITEIKFSFWDKCKMFFQDILDKLFSWIDNPFK